MDYVRFLNVKRLEPLYKAGYRLSKKREGMMASVAIAAVRSMQMN